jgi:8-amino-7-oxononanoate synthase
VITDFTSSLFLGLRHAYVELPPWACLTTGRPPQLDVGADGGLTRRLASLLGTEDAVLRRSTLHGLLDTIVALAGARGTVVMDDAAYPISHWAAAAASNWGVEVTRYRHHDADDAAAPLPPPLCSPTVGARPAAGRHRYAISKPLPTITRHTWSWTTHLP